MGSKPKTQPQASSNVAAMPQAGDTLKSHQGKTVLPDLSLADKIKALMAEHSQEEQDKAKKDLVKEFEEPDFDTATMMKIKPVVQEFSLGQMKEHYGAKADKLTPKDALSKIWKAHWPKKYYKLELLNGSKEPTRVFDRTKKAYDIKLGDENDVWEPGGYANEKPTWCSGKGKKVGVDYAIVEMIDGKETKQGQPVQAPEQAEEDDQENDD